MSNRVISMGNVRVCGRGDIWFTFRGFRELWSTVKIILVELGLFCKYAVRIWNRKVCIENYPLVEP
jgi:hypothetical protein